MYLVHSMLFLSVSELYGDELGGFLSSSTDVTCAKLRLSEALVYLNMYLEASENHYKIIVNIYG